VNATALYKQPDIFDLYDGGGIDLLCLGAAHVDPQGNVNVSKFAGRVVGPGGWEIAGGRLNILEDGDGIKFVKQLEQVTFSGEYAHETGQEVLYITERAVLKVTKNGLPIIEIAPGVFERKSRGATSKSPGDVSS